MQVYQRLDVAVQRHNYLWRIRQLRNAGYTICYQDETSCNANYRREYVWQKEQEEKLLEYRLECRGFDLERRVEGTTRKWKETDH